MYYHLIYSTYDISMYMYIFYAIYILHTFFSTLFQLQCGVVIGDLYCTCVYRPAAPVQVALEA